MTQTIEAAIYPLIVDVLCVEESWCAPDRGLDDAPGADSLDIVELQMAIEDSLGITLYDAELDEVRTVGELTELVRLKVDERAA